MMITEAFVSFFAFTLLLSHLSATSMRKLVGYKGYVDFALHGSVLFLFFGTSTDGLIQAEAAAILFSLWLRAYQWMWGFERFSARKLRFVRYAGRLTRHELSTQSNG
jgi:hypothetical protein